MKQTFRGRFMRFIDKTSTAKVEEKDGKKIYPKITCKVKISSAIPLKHRLYW